MFNVNDIPTKFQDLRQLLGDAWGEFYAVLSHEDIREIYDTHMVEHHGCAPLIEDGDTYYPGPN